MVVMRPVVIGGQDRVKKPPRVRLADQREVQVGRGGPDGHRSAERAGPGSRGRVSLGRLNGAASSRDSRYGGIPRGVRRAVQRAVVTKVVFSGRDPAPVVLAVPR